MIRPFGVGPRGEMVKAMNHRIVASKFGLHSRYYPPLLDKYSRESYKSPLSS